MRTVLFISLTFGCSILVAFLLHLFDIRITSPAAVLIIGVFLMPSSAAATCIVYRFRWREMAAMPAVFSATWWLAKMS